MTHLEKQVTNTFKNCSDGLKSWRRAQLVLMLGLSLFRKSKVTSWVPFEWFCHCSDIAAAVVYPSNLPEAPPGSFDVQSPPRIRSGAKEGSWACWALWQRMIHGDELPHLYFCGDGRGGGIGSELSVKAHWGPKDLCAWRFFRSIKRSK